MPKPPSRPKRIVLDRDIPTEIKEAFSGVTVQTLAELGWENLDNERLYAAIARDFDLFLTSDPDRRYQRALSLSPFTTVVVVVPDRRIDSYRPLYDEMRETVTYTNPGRIFVVM